MPNWNMGFFLFILNLSETPGGALLESIWLRINTECSNGTDMGNDHRWVTGNWAYLQPLTMRNAH